MPNGQAPARTAPSPAVIRRGGFPWSLRPLAGMTLSENRRERERDGQGGIANRLNQRHVLGCQPRRLPHASVHDVLHHQPSHGDRQRDLVVGGAESPKETELRLLLVRDGLPRPVTGDPRRETGPQTASIIWDGRSARSASKTTASNTSTTLTIMPTTSPPEFLATQGWTIVRVSSRQLRDHRDEKLRRVRRARRRRYFRSRGRRFLMDFGRKPSETVASPTIGPNASGRRVPRTDSPRATRTRQAADVTPVDVVDALDVADHLEHVARGAWGHPSRT